MKTQKTLAATMTAIALFTASTVSACGITECQPHGGLTRPDLEQIIADREGWGNNPRSPEKPENPPISPEPMPSTPQAPKPSDLPPVASGGNLEEDTPPAKTPSPTPTPNVGIIPPWTYEAPPGTVPVGGGETFIPIPEIKLPKAGS